MANKTVDQLTAIGTVAAGDLFVVYDIDDTAEVRKATLTQIVAAANPLLTVSGLLDTDISTPSGGDLLIYDGSDSWDNQAVTGDISIGADGVVAIAAGSIVNADVNASAAIAYSKLNLATSIDNDDLAGGIYAAVTGIGVQSKSLDMNNNDITLASNLTIGSGAGNQFNLTNASNNPTNWYLSSQEDGLGFAPVNIFYQGGDGGSGYVSLAVVRVSWDPSSSNHAKYAIDIRSSGGLVDMIELIGGTTPEVKIFQQLNVNSKAVISAVIDSDLNTITNIANADIKPGAAIDATKIGSGGVTTTEFGYVSGVTSDIQAQFDAITTSPTFAGNVTMTGNLDVDGYAVIGGASAINNDITLRIGRNFTADPGTEGKQLVVSGALTNAVGLSAQGVLIDPEMITPASGNSANIWGTQFRALNIDVSAGGTITDSATVHIAGAPTEATNNYALFVDAGVSRFDDAIRLGDGLVSNAAIGFTNDTATGLYRPSTSIMGFIQNGNEIFRIHGSGFTFNNAQANFDFVVNGDTSTNIINMDASADALAFGGRSSPSGNIAVIIDKSITSASATTLDVRGDLNVTSGSSNIFAALFQPVLTTINSGGTHGVVSTVTFVEPNISKLSGTITEAATVRIANSPTEGTNNYALIVGGTTKFEGNIFFEGPAIGMGLVSGTDIKFNKGSTRPSNYEFGTAASSDNAFQIKNSGDFGTNVGAKGTTTTLGFLHIPMCAGVPTGTPAEMTSNVSMIYDTTNNDLYIYNGSWRKAAFA